MQVFLINLASNTARLAAADAQLKRLGVVYERFDAVYGKELSQEERDKAVNRFRWWCAVGREVSPGEIGCALSHYRIYRRMIAEDMPYCCVLEDDVVLQDTFVERLEDVAQWIDPQQPQVILLSNHNCREKTTAREIRPSKGDMFTEGYVITLPAAKALLKANLPMQTPCDHWGRWVKSGAIQLYHASPAVCDQTQEESSTTIGRMRVSDLSLPQFLWHKIKRLIGKTIDSLLGGAK